MSGGAGPEAPPGRPGRRWLGTAVLCAASTLLALGAAELAARVWLTRFASDAQFRNYASLAQLEARMEALGQSPSPYLHHRYLGYVPTPDYRRWEDHHGPLGYRGDPFPQPKPAGEFRIVCLGGSTTFGTSVADPAQAYPAQLEQALHASGRTRVRVVNAGVPGWASLESLVNFQLRVLDLEPDLLIVYHSMNDLKARLVWPPSAYRGDLSGSFLYSPGLRQSATLLERSTLGRIFLIATGRAPSQLALIGNFTVLAPTERYFEYTQQKRRGEYPSGVFTEASVPEILERNPPVYFRRNLSNLVANARAHGVEPVLATFAWSERVKDPPVNAPEIVAALREQNALIRELGRELGVPVFRFAEAFPHDPALFTDAVHLNASGNQRKGRMFAHFLVRQRLVPGPNGQR